VESPSPIILFSARPREVQVIAARLGAPPCCRALEMDYMLATIAAWRAESGVDALSSCSPRTPERLSGVMNASSSSGERRSVWARAGRPASVREQANLHAEPIKPLIFLAAAG